MLTSYVEDLYSTQEEADTKMFLHAFHADLNEHRSIAIVSSDTDVEALAGSHQVAIPASITRTRSRLIDIPRLCDKLGAAVCQAVPSVNAMTGCDTVSCFVGKEGVKHHPR